MSTSSPSAGAPPLDHLQSWMQMVITHPGGVCPGMNSTDARRFLDVDVTDLDSIVTPSATLTAAERLAIYSRSYYARLLQCFESMFPILVHALGRELFNHFAVDYLQHHPPHSYTLDQLADAFPQHLGETRPDAAASPAEREPWPDFIVELATLELAILKVFDGPGLEGKVSPSGADILALLPDRLLEARPTLAPSVRLYFFRFPVSTYWLDVQRDKHPVVPGPAHSFVAVARQNYRVRIHELSASQYVFLQALDALHTVGQARDRSHQADGAGPRPPLAIIRDWLWQWSNNGFFACLSAP